MNILEFIGVGKQNAVTRSELVNRTGLCDREVRFLIAAARGRNLYYQFPRRFRILSARNTFGSKTIPIARISKGRKHFRIRERHEKVY